MIILFDGECNLCNGFVQFVIKNDRKNIFQFASLQSDYGQNICEKHNTLNLDSVILIKEDQLLFKSAAVFEIFNQLSWYRIFTIFRFLPTRFNDSAYDFIARHRLLIFGKAKSCFIPTEELKGKFLG